MKFPPKSFFEYNLEGFRESFNWEAEKAEKAQSESFDKF